MKGCTISLSKLLSRCAFRCLYLRIKNINSRSKISPPAAPPMIAAIGDFLLVDPWLDVGLDEVPVGTLEEPVAVLVVVPPPVEDVEGDGAS